MASLRIVELTLEDSAAGRDWFCQHFGLKVVMESSAQGYVLLDAGGVQLAIKQRKERAGEGGPVQLQWEVEDVVAWQQATQAVCLKPLVSSDEGYRRMVIEGPERLPLLIYDWKT